MRIVHVIESLEFGGAEQVVLMLANAMAASDEITIVCVKKPGDLAANAAPGVRIVTLGKGEGNDPLLSWRLMRLLRARRAQVLHGHNWGIFLECGLAGWLARVPVRLHTIHGPYAAGGEDRVARFKRALRQRLEYAVARLYHRLVPVSEAIRNYLVQERGLGEDRVVTIHNGIAPHDHPAPVRAADTGQLTFIAVGRLAEIKNHELMLDAFAAFARRDPRARLMIVGDGPRRMALEQRARQLRIDDRVEFAGFRGDVAGLLARADVFLVSSHYEGVSVAVLEAMRARLPVIATRVGGMPETIHDGREGILVPPGDAVAMTEAMSRLAASASLRRTMGEAGFDRFGREFSLENMLAGYRSLYRQAAGAAA